VTASAGNDTKTSSARTSRQGFLFGRAKRLQMIALYSWSAPSKGGLTGGLLYSLFHARVSYLEALGDQGCIYAFLKRPSDRITKEEGANGIVLDPVCRRSMRWTLDVQVTTRTERTFLTPRAGSLAGLRSCVYRGNVRLDSSPNPTYQLLCNIKSEIDVLTPGNRRVCHGLPISWRI